jgi:hypothetical protein
LDSLPPGPGFPSPHRPGFYPPAANWLPDCCFDVRRAGDDGPYKGFIDSGDALAVSLGEAWRRMQATAGVDLDTIGANTHDNARILEVDSRRGYLLPPAAISSGQQSELTETMEERIGEVLEMTKSRKFTEKQENSHHRVRPEDLYVYVTHTKRITMLHIPDEVQKVSS